MTALPNPDDEVDPQALAKRLEALVQNLPRLVHEQVAAAKADTEIALELTRELEKTSRRGTRRRGK